MTDAPFLTDRFDNALAYASALHRALHCSVVRAPNALRP